MKEKYDGYTITFSGSHGYPTINVNGKNVLLHRYIWEKCEGSIPEGYEIHHMDKNKLNYDFSNLELIRIKDHHSKHAKENGLGKSNKGKSKNYQSGCVKLAKAIRLVKDGAEVWFQSETDAVRFLGLKSVGSIGNVLSGKAKTAKGWMVYEVSK